MTGFRSYTLYNPPQWLVETCVVERGKAVTVSDPGGASLVVLRILKLRDRRENTALLAAPAAA